MIPRLLAGVEESIIALLLAAMTLLVIVEVILRYGFSSGLLWIQELTLLLAAWLVLTGAAYGVKKGSHIGMDMAVRRLRPLWRRRAGALAALLCLLYCALFLAGSWEYLVKIKHFGIAMEDLPVPLWLAHGILLPGFLLLAFRFSQLLWKIIHKRADGILLGDEAADALVDRESGDGQGGERRR
ncbi:MAG: TRAP transporter small permease subunit [Alphaproteobacteria bacterium]|jgi:C4-dicarboxylate transporter DctQ subunit|nr:TRAP transporter small permease subunit [Alphaproteobacteria bacterium]